MSFSPRFDDALVMASRLHAQQLRKGTSIPYVGHLLGVTSLVIEQGATEDEAIAALLHDAIEDQGGADTREEIRRRFGDVVTDIVVGCSDTDAFPKPPWSERKRAYIAHLGTASPSVRLVSCADKLHNARAILGDYRQVGEALWDRFTGGRDGTLWYYRTLAALFEELGPWPLAGELARTVAELARLTGG